MVISLLWWCAQRNAHSVRYEEQGQLFHSGGHETKMLLSLLSMKVFMDSKILVSRGVPHSFGCGVLKSQRTFGKICRQQVEEYTQKRHKRKISAEKIDPYILDAGWQQEKHTESGFKVTKIHFSSCSEKAVQWPPLQQRKHEERKQFSFQYIFLYFCRRLFYFPSVVIKTQPVQLSILWLILS